MFSIAFGLPVVDGKSNDARKFVDQLLDEKSSHFKERMQRRGYTRFKIFHQQWPVEQFVIYAEADDLHNTMKGDHGEDDSQFEAWFKEQYEALSGHHTNKLAPHISDLVMDWHPEKGGSKTHHR